ncbi:hypothetical protein GCM10009827_055730 [Dactylosporangium maewongense]|uniref:Uncharacterized protein n=1 Tax=Dactylosporangium maewongense TaxID=634393 RepID=A0ABP4LVL3_9ACTN
MPGRSRALMLYSGMSADGTTAVGTLVSLPGGGELKGPSDMMRWTCPTTR